MKWVVPLRNALNSVEYRNWLFYIYESDVPYLVAEFFANGKIQQTRKWMIEESMTPSDVIRTAWLCVLTAEEHEAREAFKYKGKKIFGPHFNVDKLVDLSTYKANLDIKEPVGV